MNSLEVRYFAMFREVADKDTETIAVENEKTYADLYHTLSNRYHFPLGIEMVQVAVNDEFVDIETPIRAGASVVFIPPVAGG